jgi:hypothetical protein
MATMTQSTPETSVLFSLAELARIEEERVHEEEREQRRERHERRLARDRAEAAERAAEAARVASETEARAERQRQDLEDQVRRQAREQAAIETARIQAEAKAKLDADNAVRSHELDLLRTKNERYRGRLRYVFAAFVGLVALSGAASAFSVDQHLTALNARTVELERGRAEALAAHERSLTITLERLDKRHEALSRVELPHAEALRDAADKARRALEGASLDADRLAVFERALDAWQLRADHHARLQALDTRHRDLEAWAMKQRQTKLLDDSRRLAAKAHAAGADERALDAFGKSLEALAASLRAGASGGGGVITTTDDGGGTCTDPHDPLCGFDGKILRTP